MVAFLEFGQQRATLWTLRERHAAGNLLGNDFDHQRTARVDARLKPPTPHFLLCKVVEEGSARRFLRGATVLLLGGGRAAVHVNLHLVNLVFCKRDVPEPYTLIATGRKRSFSARDHDA